MPQKRDSLTQGSASQACVRPPEVPAELIELIRRMRAPIVITHVVPDADALGAMLTVAIARAQDECVPKISLPDGSLSQRLEFMFAEAGVSVATPGDFASADGFIVQPALAYNSVIRMVVQHAPKSKLIWPVH